MSFASIIAFVATLIGIPWLIVRIPNDYFSEKKRVRKLWNDHRPIIRAILLAAKNLFGYLLIIAGTIMLVLPGQGILTIVIGVVFIDIPGKYRFEKWIIDRPKILKSINWLRIRAKREPLIL